MYGGYKYVYVLSFSVRQMIWNWIGQYFTFSVCIFLMCVIPARHVIFVFAVNYSVTNNTDGGLEGSNQDKINDNTVMDACKSSN